MARKPKTASQDASTLNEQKIAKKGTWNDRNEELASRKISILNGSLKNGWAHLPEPNLLPQEKVNAKREIQPYVSLESQGYVLLPPKENSRPSLERKRNASRFCHCLT